MGKCVSFTIILHLSLQESSPSLKNMSYVRWDYVTPDIILIGANFKGHQTLMSYGIGSVIMPYNLVWVWLLFSWQLKFVNHLLGNNILCTIAIDNHVTSATLAFYPCMENGSSMAILCVFLSGGEELAYNKRGTFSHSVNCIFGKVVHYL